MKFNFPVFLMTAAILVSSCGKKLASDGFDPKDFAKEVAEFVQFNGWEHLAPADTLNEEIDLFIDYSTCVSEAGNSLYYRTVHPVIVDMNPTYWSIKGSVIRKETNNRQMVYQLLNSVNEVNYADIKGAVEQIVNGDNHAVLITDGEYYMKGGVKDNLNNPYLADSFRKWLNRGFDIYIYSEPYRESGRYDKFRYYMFFTDDNVENNIRDRFDRSAPAQNDVKMIHLSGKLPELTAGEGYPDINVSLSPNTMLNWKGDHCDVQEYYANWNKIYKYLLDSAYDENGNPLEDGDYLVKGLFLNNGASEAFKVENVRIDAYNIGESFVNYETSKMLEEAPSRCVLPMKAKLFKIDKALFDETGEIAIMLDKDNIYDGLDAFPNLLKVDIVADRVVENFSQNNEINDRFQWMSISSAQGGNFNTSLYESIRQILLDPAMNPVQSKPAVLYTIYISTYSL